MIILEYTGLELYKYILLNLGGLFMKKRKILSWTSVVLPMLILASLIGCSSGLESDVSVEGIATPNGQMSVQKVVVPPVSLDNTEWGGNTNFPEEYTGPAYVIIRFVDSTYAVLLKSDITRTSCTYTYDADLGEGTITTEGNTESAFTADGETISIAAGIFDYGFDVQFLPAVDDPI
jgi:hypothetical protein